nr:54s ribosomal protein l24, mitochondrial [Quercus suber]
MALVFRHKPRVLVVAKRSFSSTVPRSISLQWEKNDPEALADAIPPYPYPTRWYKQSRLGLYGGQRIQFGNNVGKKIEVKTRRSWHPNVVNKKLFSKALERRVQVRVTARVLRTIEKCGGLDEYLLGEKEARIRTLGESGWWLRWAIMRTNVVQNRFAKARAALGLHDPEPLSSATQDVESAIEQDSSVSMLEQASEEEAHVAAEEGEPVTSDDAFTIETGPDLPPLKFRVGPGRHVVLTPFGWRRTRPHPLRWILMDKEKIAKKRNIEEKIKNRTSTELRHFQNELDRKIYLHNKAVADGYADFLPAEPSFLESADPTLEESSEPVSVESTEPMPIESREPELLGSSEPTLKESTESTSVESAERKEESLADTGDLTSETREASLASDQVDDPVYGGDDLVQPQGLAYTTKISRYNRDRMLDEARKVLEKTYRKAANQAVDRAYEAHVVMRDTRTERRRLKKHPTGFSKNNSKEKAAMRKTVIAEHRRTV